MKLLKSILPLALLAGTIAAHAQTKPNIDVECEANHAEDQLGKMYCTALRDAVAKNPRYILGHPPTGDTKKHFWTIRVSTMPGATFVLRDGTRVNPSAVAITLTFDQRKDLGGVVGTESTYITMWVATVTVADQIEPATNQLVAGVDEQIIKSGIE